MHFFFHLLFLLLGYRERANTGCAEASQTSAVNHHRPLCKYTINNALQTSNKCWFEQKQTQIPSKFSFLRAFSCLKSVATSVTHLSTAATDCSGLTAVVNPRVVWFTWNPLLAVKLILCVTMRHFEKLYFVMS